jgi:c-di-GMP-specific phosphodiesterase
MQSEATSEKIVRSVLTLGRDLGLDVVAEGVEDMVLAECLGSFGCILGQGYGFARALAYDAAEVFLANSISQALQKSA